MIQIIIDRSARTLDAQGHADYAPPGQDIVCAGVSILLQTLYHRLRSAGLLAEDGSLEPGNIFLRILDDEGVGALASEAWLDLTEYGLQLLAEAYPENVTVAVTRA